MVSNTSKQILFFGVSFPWHSIGQLQKIIGKMNHFMNSDTKGDVMESLVKDKFPVTGFVRMIINLRVLPKLFKN